MSSTLTQIHRKSLCHRPGVISVLGAENGVHPVNEEGIFHINHFHAHRLYPPARPPREWTESVEGSLCMYACRFQTAENVKVLKTLSKH